MFLPKFFTTTLDGYQWSDSRPGGFISEERITIPIGKEAIATKFVRFPKYIFGRHKLRVEYTNVLSEAIKIYRFQTKIVVCT
jgi:hypothetical protein